MPIPHVVSAVSGDCAGRRWTITDAGGVPRLIYELSKGRSVNNTKVFSFRNKLLTVYVAVAIASCNSDLADPNFCQFVEFLRQSLSSIANSKLNLYSDSD